MENITDKDLLTAVETVIEIYNQSEDKNDSLYHTKVMSYIKELEELSNCKKYKKYSHVVIGKSVDTIIYNYKTCDKHDKFTYKIGDKIRIIKPEKKFKFLKGKKGTIMNILKYNKKSYRQVFILMDDAKIVEKIKFINTGKPLHPTNDISWIGIYLAQIRFTTSEENSNNINRTFPDLYIDTTDNKPIVID
jgi:hypothetical protein